MVSPGGPRDRLDLRFQAAAEDYQINALTNIRSTAEKWSGTLTALLGISGTVGVVAGPSLLKDIPDWGILPAFIVRIIVAIFTIGAGAAAGWALLLAARAAQGATPQAYDDWGGERLEQETASRSEIAARQLKCSRIWGLVAAILVFIVGVIALLSAIPAAASQSQSMLVVTIDGEVFCGPLVGDSSAVRTVGGAVTGKVATALPVDSC